MIRRLLKLLVFLACLGIAAILIAAGLLATESGSRWLVYRVIEQNDVPLTIGKIQGRLLDEISLHDLHYLDRDGNEITANSARLVWSPLDLLALHLDVTSIDIDQLTVRAATGNETGSPEIPAIEFPALPVTVTISKLELNNTRIVNVNGERLIERVRASLAVNMHKLVLRIEHVRSNDQQLSGIATMIQKDVPRVDVDLQWSGTIEDELSQAYLQIKGPQNDLSVQFELSSIASIRAHGNLDLATTPHSGTLQGEVSGKLPQGASNHVKLLAPLSFAFTGNMNFIEGHVATKLQTASGEKFSLEMESHAALPGTASKALNVSLDWKTTPDNENPLLLQSGQGDIEYRDGILTIDHQLNAPYAIRLTGNVGFAGQTRLDFKLDWHDIHVAIPDKSSLQIPSGYLGISGTPSSLDILASTQFAVVKNPADETASVDDKMFTKISMDGNMDISGGFPTGNFRGKLDGPVPAVLKDQVKVLEPLLFNATFVRENATLALTGAGLSANEDRFDLALDSHITFPPGEGMELSADVAWSVQPTSDPSRLERIAGNGTVKYQADRLIVTHDLVSPFPANLEGIVTFHAGSESILRFDINWQDLEFPLRGYPPLQSERGHVHLEGPVSSLSIRADSRFPSTPAGPAVIDVDANWSAPLLEINRVNITALDGNMHGSGQANIENTIHGQFDLQARNINLESINPDFISRIDLSAKLDFSLEDNRLNGRLQVPSLSGEWRGYPLRGNADVSRMANHVQVRNLHLESGRNTIDMQLEMNKTLAGFADIAITDMSVFSSELAGKVNGRFEIGGTTKAARINGRLRGENIAAFDLRIASVEADSLIDLGSRQDSTLDIRSGELQYQDIVLDELTIKGKGVTGAHTLKLDANGEELMVTASLNGQLHDRTWQGSMSQLIINTPRTGEWKLDRPASITWQGEKHRFNAGNTCLEQADASVCLQASGDIQHDVKATIQIDRLPMTLAQPWLPETVSLNGTVSGEILLDRMDEHWELQTRMEGTGTQVGVGYEEDSETLDIEEVMLMAEATRTRRVWDLQLRSPEYFDIRLQGSIQNTQNRPVTADMKVDLYRIDWLAGIEPALTGSRGRFEANLQASGNVDQPRIQGNFNLYDGQLSVLPIGLNLDQVSGKLESGRERSQMLISSVLGNNNKQLELTGDVILDAAQHYPYRLQVRGEKFPLVRTVDITMDTSPDLDMHGTLKLHHVRGNVAIPYLDMQVTSLPEDSVNVSPDTVVVQSKKAGAEPVEESTSGSDFIRNRLDIDISVSLGPDIHIHGFGLDTKLAGDINVVKPVGIYQPRGEGFVNLSEGSYRAYGQNLIIEKGQLQFAGPLDNPGINVRAYRPNLKVHPGVRVAGNVRQPKLSLYSESGLSEADTLSYLVTGRPITGVSSNQEANLLAQAALSLGTQESTVLATEIENLFGLEEFNVGADETYQSTTVSATKRLSPNLTFSPSFNPFDQLWTFILNYQLTDHWSVQAESGVSQAGDIIYSIESNKISELFKNIWSFD